MKEVTVEEYLREQCYLHGALCEKHTAPGTRSVPDRLITLPWGVMDLVETKRPVGGRYEPGQERDHKARAERGIPVYLIRTKHEVDLYVRWRVVNGAHYEPLWSVPLMNSTPPRDCLCTNLECTRCYPEE